MTFLHLKKQCLVLGILILIVLFYFKPHCRNEKPQILRDSDVGPPLPYIYGITPTYSRMNQKAELTRLSQTLMHLKNFHWIVVEDSLSATELVTNFLKKSSLKSIHLFTKSANVSRYQKNFAKGVEQRNLGLQWLRGHLKKTKKRRGLVYFMDDNNAYDLKVFEEIRKIKRVGVWPVGLVGALRLETPLVTDGRVTGFNAVWKPYRPFPIDMAGFAINVSLIMAHPEAKFSRRFPRGFQESIILSYLTTVKDLEPLANNCSEVYVWHTRTRPAQLLNTSLLERINKSVTIIPFNNIEV